MPAPDRPAGLVARRVLDPPLAGLLAVLVEGGLPVVVAGPDESQRRSFLAAFADRQGAPTAVELASADDAIARLTARTFLLRAGEGLPVSATIEADSLERVFGRLRADPIGLSDDDLTAIGVVVVLDHSGRVASAHWVRPLARDTHGHVQRLGPAVLAARDPRSDRLEHFAWGVMPELAIRLGRVAGDLEADAQARAAEIAAAARSVV